MVTVSEFDLADHLRTRGLMVGFLEEAAKDPDPRVFAHAVGTVGRAIRRHGVPDEEPGRREAAEPAAA